MLEDAQLVWRFNRGDREALRRIYEKYKDDLLTLSTALLNVHCAKYCITYFKITNATT